MLIYSYYEEYERDGSRLLPLSQGSLYYHLVQICIIQNFNIYCCCW